MRNLLTGRAFVRFAGLLFGLCQGFGAAAQTDTATADPGLTWRMGLDSLQANPSKLGGGLTLGVMRPLSDGYYVGGTIYAGALGEAGGFYVGGVEFGRAIAINSDYFIDTSLYLGGGGGAGQVPGDGLATRARLGLGRHLRQWGLSGWDVLLGVGRLNVRGSSIHASSLELLLQRRFDLGIRTGEASAGRYSDGGTPASLSLAAVRPRLARYRTAGTGSGTVDTLGIEAEFDLGSSAWHPLVKTMGAASGNAQGYADWMAGARRYMAIGSAGLSAYVDLGLGTGGGGAIASGSGLLAQAGGGLQLQLAKRWALQVEAGHLHSQGSFRANYMGVSLNWQDSGRRAAGDAQSADSARLPQAWAVRASVSQLKGNALLRQGTASDRSDIQTMDLQIERQVGARAYLAGRASTAMLGHAGGYQAGLLGAGWREPFHGWTINPEVTLGVAGGGGVATRGGSVASWQLNLGRPLSRSSEWTIGLGKMTALRSGGLNSTTAMLGLTQHFTMR